MSDLVTFLHARITEDEDIARKAEGGCRYTWPLWTVTAASVRGHDLGSRGSVEASPARVLAECAAKRAIAAEHGPPRADAVVSVDRQLGACTAANDYPPRCRVCTSMTKQGATRFAAPCQTLRLLVQPYADHPDFNPAWTSGVTS